MSSSDPPAQGWQRWRSSSALRRLTAGVVAGVLGTIGAWAFGWWLIDVPRRVVAVGILVVGMLATFAGARARRILASYSTSARNRLQARSAGWSQRRAALVGLGTAFAIMLVCVILLIAVGSAERSIARERWQRFDLGAPAPAARAAMGLRPRAFDYPGPGFYAGGGYRINKQRGSETRSVRVDMWQARIELHAAWFVGYDEDGMVVWKAEAAT